MTLLTPTAREQIEERVQRGERLSCEEGLALYHEPDLEWVGRLANLVRERRYQDRTTYVVNMHLNYSNLCTLSCMFCAFAKKRGEEGAYEMSLDEMVERVAVLGDIDGAEVHIVGGLHPDYPYEYYPRLLATLRQRYPKVHLKAFTAVEIDYFAELAGKDVDWVLQDLREHGLGSMPGGGAEVLTDRIHQKLYRDKMGPDRWLEVHARAHRLGIRTSATLLAGHIESLQERVVHLQRLRELQDQTGGFLAYIPLRFHPDNTPLRKLPFMDSDQILRNVAVGRLMLDNFDHIKAYWVMSGLETAARSQWFGADDFDGTVVDERITHMAGCETPVGVTEGSLTNLIREAGRRPVRRDALYNPID
ncbi:MAG: aminofutalosine synthase MqnE [Candidatus Eremiobacteraeota bacterium]|nr:aminofutalosine synthase MqnE [Candidatus Eremiobacteraeota bacterium]